MKIAYLFLNGELLGKKEFYKNFILKNEGDIFCADGGANLTYMLNLKPLEIWGDLDSIDKEVHKYYKSEEIKIETFPAEKNKTDSELLLDYLSKKAYDRIYCIAGLGGRISHELTNLNLCFKYENLYFLTEDELLFAIDREYRFENLINKTTSFIVFSDEVKALNLKGFKYNLKNLNLKRGDSRCTSNIIIENGAEIFFEAGKILAVIEN